MSVSSRLTAPVLAIVGDPSRTRMEQAIGADERVTLALRAFRAVKITTMDASQDPMLAPSASQGPRTVVLGLDGKSVAVLPLERVTAGAVWDALRTAIRTGYGADLDALVEREREVQRDLDRVEIDRKALTRSPLSDAQWKAETARLDERRRDIRTRERAIWALTRRA